MLHINEENDMHICNKDESLKIVVKKHKDGYVNVRKQ